MSDSKEEDIKDETKKSEEYNEDSYYDKYYEDYSCDEFVEDSCYQDHSDGVRYEEDSEEERNRLQDDWGFKVYQKQNSNLPIIFKNDKYEYDPYNDVHRTIFEESDVFDSEDFKIDLSEFSSNSFDILEDCICCYPDDLSKLELDEALEAMALDSYLRIEDDQIRDGLRHILELTHEGLVEYYNYSFTNESERHFRFFLNVFCNEHKKYIKSPNKSSKFSLKLVFKSENPQNNNVFKEKVTQIVFTPKFCTEFLEFSVSLIELMKIVFWYLGIKKVIFLDFSETQEFRQQLKLMDHYFREFLSSSDLKDEPMYLLDSE